MKNDFIRARIEPHLKAEVHTVLEEIGVTPTQAITIFYKQIQLRHGLPFDIAIPNAETARAIREAKKGKGIVICKDAEDLFKKLGI